MNSALTRGWYIACRARDLRRRPLAVTIAGQGLVLCRDARGRAYALEDRCAHRGAPLSRGRACGDLLQCPYHGWRYDAGGRAVEIPALGPGAVPPEAAAVPAYPVREQQGFVWVAPVDPPPDTGPHAFAHFDEPGWTRFLLRNRFRASVEACLENFLDCPHATFVHRYWFRVPTARPVRVTVTTLADGAQAEYFDEPREASAVWALLAPRGGRMRHTDRYIAPNVSQVDYDFPNGLHYTITSCCTPLAPDATMVYTLISFRYGRIGPLVRLLFEPLSRLIIAQDVRMLDACHAKRERHAPHRGVSSPADLLGPHIAAWSGALRAGRKPPPAGEVRHAEIHL